MPLVGAWVLKQGGQQAFAQMPVFPGHDSHPLQSDLQGLCGASGSSGQAANCHRGSRHDQAPPYHLRRSKTRPTIQSQPSKKSRNYPLISTPHLTPNKVSIDCWLRFPGPLQMAIYLETCNDAFVPHSPRKKELIKEQIRLLLRSASPHSSCYCLSHLNFDYILSLGVAGFQFY